MKFIILFIPFFLFADFFQLDVGKKYKVKNLNGSKIRLFKNLELRIFEDIEINESNVNRKFVENLFLKSDSLNSSEGFLIKYKDGSYIKCKKSRRINVDLKENKCAIQSELSSTTIEVERERFVLECFEKVI